MTKPTEQVFSSGSDCLNVGINVAKALSHAVETYDGEIGSVFKTAENEVAELRQILKTIKRRVPQQQLQPDNRLVKSRGAQNCLN